VHLRQGNINLLPSNNSMVLQTSRHLDMGPSKLPTLTFLGMSRPSGRP
jgi:hypothetical protein